MGIIKTMDTKEKLENDLKEAIRAKDTIRKRTLRMVISAIRLVEVDKRQPLDESGVLAILQKEVKSRQEVIEESKRADRPDLIAEAEAEIAVLEEYLPSPLSPEELECLAQQVINETGASSPKEMGQVMKALVPRLEGRATGQQASQVVRKLLQGND
jgi:uncharacterized protein YqeY